MIALRELQSSIVATILDRPRRLPSGALGYSSCFSDVPIDVHRHRVFSSLAEVLASHFPVVRRIAGANAFRAMACEFVRSHPPQSPVMSQYGELFPFFVHQCKATGNKALLSDVAQLEWTWLRTYHARDAQSVLPIEMGRLPLATLGQSILGLNPTASIVCSPFPIVSIWKAFAFGDKANSVPKGKARECALVVRPALDVLVVQLSLGNQSFLRALRARVPISEAADYASARDGSFDFQTSFASLLNAGAFSTVELRQQHAQKRGTGQSDEIAYETLH